MAAHVLVTGVTGYIGGDLFHVLYDAHPNLNYTVLVRSKDKGEAVKSKYPKANYIVCSNDGSSTLEDAASKADIVVHTANSSDDKDSVTALIAGLVKGHSKSKFGYLIHTTGTGILCWDDQSGKNFGDAPVKTYNDWDNVDEILSLPDGALHKDVDQIVLEAKAKHHDVLKAVLVSPSTIYGQGRGTGNTISLQLPALVRRAFKTSSAPVAGAGKSQWNNIHIHDLSNLYLKLVESALEDDIAKQNEIWGPKAYFIGESGVHNCADLARKVAKSIHKQGFSAQEWKDKSIDPSTFEEGVFDDLIAYTFAWNSVATGLRAKKLLGWTPTAPAIEDTIDETVRIEHEKMQKK